MNFKIQSKNNEELLNKLKFYLLINKNQKCFSNDSYKVMMF